MHKISLDRQDIALLDLLAQDHNLPKNELAERVHLSPSQCFRRLKRLEQSGLIKRYTIDIDHQKLGLDVSAMVMVKYNKLIPNALESLITVIQNNPIIDLVYSITGEHDYLMHVNCASMREFNILLSDTLNQDYIASLHSYMLLDCVKQKSPMAQVKAAS